MDVPATGTLLVTGMLEAIPVEEILTADGSCRLSVAIRPTVTV